LILKLKNPYTCQHLGGVRLLWMVQVTLLNSQIRVFIVSLEAPSRTLFFGEARVHVSVMVCPQWALSLSLSLFSFSSPNKYSLVLFIFGISILILILLILDFISWPFYTSFIYFWFSHSLSICHVLFLFIKYLFFCFLFCFLVFFKKSFIDFQFYFLIQVYEALFFFQFDPHFFLLKLFFFSI
jgi:hypothetical protein